jgi:Ca-activated chloride channel family protein
VAGALMILGLARPQLGRGQADVEASGINIVLALDVSGSMQALDFQLENQLANRLEVVKSVVSTVIEDWPNDRRGLVAFGGEPYLVSPLTLDHDWLQQNLERVQLGAVEDGTAIGSAIATSVNRLRDTTAKSKIVVAVDRRYEQRRQGLARRRRRSREGDGREGLYDRRRCAR